jgi:D-lyxose ketol-isomerase
MLTRAQVRHAQARAAAMMQAAGVVFTPEEADAIAVVDFGLNHLEIEGAQILTFFNSERVSAKVIALFPGQTLPEHWHPPIGEDPGKEETLRVIRGKLYCGLPGEGPVRHATLPAGKETRYTCRRELAMGPAGQITLAPGVPHWMQAGPEGAVLFSFSSCARDILDGFTDPDIVRETRILD